MLTRPEGSNHSQRKIHRSSRFDSGYADIYCMYILGLHLREGRTRKRKIWLIWILIKSIHTDFTLGIYLTLRFRSAPSSSRARSRRLPGEKPHTHCPALVCTPLQENNLWPSQPNAPTVGYYSSQYIRISTSLSLHILNSLDFSLSSNFGCLYPMSQDIQTKNVTENSSFELSPPGIVPHTNTVKLSSEW